MLTNINGIIILFDAYYDFKTDQIHLVFCFHKTLLFILPLCLRRREIEDVSGIWQTCVPFKATSFAHEHVLRPPRASHHYLIKENICLLMCYGEGVHLAQWWGTRSAHLHLHRYLLFPLEVCFSFCLQVFGGRGISEEVFKPCISVFMKMEFNTMSRENEDFKWLPKNGQI